MGDILINSLRGRRTKGREGGGGEVECEREARSLGARREKRPTIALRARIQLPPSLPFVRRPRRLTDKLYFHLATAYGVMGNDNVDHYSKRKSFSSIILRKDGHYSNY